MTKICLSLFIVASFGGILASYAETARPGSLLYSFKTNISDNVASVLCSFDLPCAK